MSQRNHTVVNVNIYSRGIRFAVHLYLQLNLFMSIWAKAEREGLFRTTTTTNGRLISNSFIEINHANNLNARRAHCEVKLHAKHLAIVMCGTHSIDLN
jgi:hypothetical protein